MDPVSLTLGILPIVISAVSGFSILQQKIQLMRHYRKEVEWLRTKVDVQARCFKGEIHHLAIDTLDARKAQSLIRDDDHAYWKNKDVDGSLAKHIGELSPEFITAVQEIKAASAQIAAKLAIFALPDETSSLFKATKDKFRIAFRKDEYKEHIQNLKEWIAELKRIRKLACAIKKQSAAKAKEIQKEQNEPAAGVITETEVTTVRQYRDIRRLSLEFQALLQQQWSCCDHSHSYHSGRLFLCCIPQQNSIAWLLEFAGRHGCTSLSNRLLFNVSSQQLGLMAPDEGPNRPTSKKPRLSPQRHVPGDYIAKKSEGSDSGNEYHGSDAASSEDMGSLCRLLKAYSATSTSRARSRVFRYVGAQRRKQFMFEPKPAEAQSLGGWDTHRITSLVEILNRRIRDVILDRERIQLALVLVRGALMNHSTLGWPQGCVMEGISFFNKYDADIDVSALLNTLSIQMQVGNSAASDTNMEDISATVSEDTLQYTFGIRNQVLYRLGVALLSIGLWSKVGWEDVAAVRRKADALDSLGKKFSHAVKRLINCDFGMDTADLSDERLQVEIFRAVIVPLERLAEFHRQAEPERWRWQAVPNWSGETSNAFRVR